MRTVFATIALSTMIALLGCGQGNIETANDSSTASTSSDTPSTENDNVSTPSEESSTSTTSNSQDETAGNTTTTAVFAGGCFWCTEAVFEQLDGVSNVVSGYAGDTKERAVYELVSTGFTKHAEAIQITYDPAKLTYQKLLEVFFATHDPTTLNRQGNDTGPQYRSAVFFANETEKEVAAKIIEKLNASGKYTSKIVTTLEPLTGFYEAEDYHQDFAKRNPYNGYIRGISDPKVEKAKKQFPDLIKEQ